MECTVPITLMSLYYMLYATCCMLGMVTAMVQVGTCANKGSCTLVCSIACMTSWNAGSASHNTGLYWVTY